MLILLHVFASCLRCVLHSMASHIDLAVQKQYPKAVLIPHTWSRSEAQHDVDQRLAQHNTQACTQGYRSTGNRIHDCLSKVIPSCIEITNLASRCGYRQPPHQLRIHFAFAFAQCPNQPRFCRVMSWERMLRISGSRAHVLLDLWIASSLDRELSIWSNFQSRG